MPLEFFAQRFLQPRSTVTCAFACATLKSALVLLPVPARRIDINCYRSHWKKYYTDCSLSHYAARSTPLGWPGGRWRAGRRGLRVTPRFGQMALSVLIGILIDCGSFSFVCQLLELCALQ